MKQPNLFEAKIMAKKFVYPRWEGGDLAPVEVSFREIVPEVPDTGYLTHSIYYYPAKFIPQVVRFCIREFTGKGDTVLDPFAGSGTVGLEAFITERNAILLDLNYLLEVIAPLKIYRGKEEIELRALQKAIKAVRQEKEQFIPDYSNIRYWYPEEMFEVISRYWAGVKKLDEGVYKWVLQAALARLSKQFSWAEHRAPKLFKSRSKKQYILDLLQRDWRRLLDERLLALSEKYLEAVDDLQALTRGYSNKIEYYAGVDSAKFRVKGVEAVEALITSPPYLQAQEYIRTSKLELYWLGYTEKQIREISKLEIPYRKAERQIETPTLNNVRERLQRQRLRRLLDSYFDHTIAALENNAALLRKGGKLCVFIGNPKVDGIEVETWRVFAEYFMERGFRFEAVFEDKIKSRQLFKRRKNKNPEGMKAEYLLVMSKT